MTFRPKFKRPVEQTRASYHRTGDCECRRQADGRFPATGSKHGGYLKCMKCGQLRKWRLKR